MTTEQQLKLMEAKAPKLSKIKSVDVLNDTVRKYESMFKLKGKILEFLNALKEYSCLYKGVSFRKRTAWAEVFGVSERTIKRWLSKLAKLGIIKEVQAYEPSGRQMWNHVVIQPIKPVDKEVAEVAEKQENVPPSGNNVSSLKDKSLKQNLKNIIKNVDTPVREEINLPVDNLRSDKTKYLPAYIPTAFANKIKDFCDTSGDINKFWSKISLASKKTGLVDYDDADIAVQAAENMFENRTFIDDKTTHGYLGYFFGIVRKMMNNVLKRKEQEADKLKQEMIVINQRMNQEKNTAPIPFFNWLES